MKKIISICILGAMLLATMSCGKHVNGDEFPVESIGIIVPATANQDQITGIVISAPLLYDYRLGYRLAIDENKDGVFDVKKEHYAWMPNDMYHEVPHNVPIIVKAVHFKEAHFFGDCDEYIIFNWQLVTKVVKGTNDTIQQTKVKELKKQTLHGQGTHVKK